MSNEHPTDPGVGKNNPDQPEPPQYRHNEQGAGKNQWQVPSQQSGSPGAQGTQGDQSQQRWQQWEASQPPQNQQQNWQGQQYQQPPQPQYQPDQQAQQYAYTQEPEKESKFLPILGVVLAVLLALVLVAGAAYYMGWIVDKDGAEDSDGKAASSSSQSQGEEGEGTDDEDAAAESEGTATDDEEEATDDEEDADDEASEDEEESRPAHPKLPSGAVPANSAAEEGKPAGDFNNAYTGSDLTSKPFAVAVRDAFVSHYLDTDRTNGTVSAYSSVTGQTYSMKCRDNGDYVTCTGGNNAIVYIS